MHVLRFRATFNVLSFVFIVQLGSSLMHNKTKGNMWPGFPIIVSNSVFSLGSQTFPRVTSCLALPATVLVLALKIPCSRIPLGSGHLVTLQTVYTTSKPELSWTPEIYSAASRISLNLRFPQLPNSRWTQTEFIYSIQNFFLDFST